MIKNTFYGFFGLSLLLLLTGCLESKNPLPTTPRDYSQSPFIGSWTTQPNQEGLDTDFLVVFHLDNTDYLTAILADKKMYEPTVEAIEEAKNDKDTEIFQVTFSNVGGQMFANALMIKSETPHYAITKFAMDGANGFRLWGIKDDSISEAVKKSSIDSDSAAVTLSPEDLAKFVASFKDEDYQQPNVYRRVE